MSVLESIFRCKPMEVIKAEESSEKLERHLGVFDLLMIGIGGTVGTGIFATAAKIIADEAGPAAAVSWALGGLGCFLSGFAYMELTTVISSAGSCYAYSYHALGELPAVIAGWLLTLEYAVSGAGVARSWAEKVQEVAKDFGGKAQDGNDYQWLNEKHVNLMGFLIQSLACVFLLVGLRIGKNVINTITMLKITIVLFMIIAGFAYSTSSNFDPFLPARETTEDGSPGKYGVSGVMLGATQAFFGYVGFDEVCCLAAETNNPRRVMPRAVFGVIFGTCALSVLASLALAGLAPYAVVTSFAHGFELANQHWAKRIVQFGEILSMPVVVLIAFLAQPRLQYAMAMDGLLPKVFALVDKNGTIFWGTFISGVIFSVVALTIPFQALWEVVSFGVLCSFNMTNSSLVLVRTKDARPVLAPILQCSYVLLSAISAFIWQKFVIESTGHPTVAIVLASIFSFLSCAVVVGMYITCPLKEPSDNMFSAPLVPFTPALAVAVNWYMISQLSYSSLGYGFCWILAAVVSYCAFGYWNSVGRKTNWDRSHHFRTQGPRMSSVYYEPESKLKKIGSNLDDCKNGYTNTGTPQVRMSK